MTSDDRQQHFSMNERNKTKSDKYLSIMWERQCKSSPFILMHILWSRLFFVEFVECRQMSLQISSSNFFEAIRFCFHHVNGNLEGRELGIFLSLSRISEINFPLAKNLISQSARYLLVWKDLSFARISHL